METIGIQIKKIRKEKGLTQQQLADKLHVSQAMIGQYENGKRQPKEQTIKKIASALDVPESDLTGKIKVIDIFSGGISNVIDTHGLSQIGQEVAKDYLASIKKGSPQAFEAGKSIINNMMDEIYLNKILDCYEELNLEGRKKSPRASGTAHQNTRIQSR